MQKHFVQFLSPGTFVSEVSEREIPEWNVDLAQAMAINITERYNAKPYGFRFITRSRSETDLDSTITDHSGIYYLGGTIYTKEEILAGTDPKEEILRSNVRSNNIARVVVNTNSWKVTMPLRDEDVVL